MFGFIPIIFRVIFNVLSNILIHAFLIISDLKRIKSFILIAVSEDRRFICFVN